MTETFAERLRRLRTEHGITIAALAAEAGVSEGAIRQLETGHVKSPSFTVGLRLAHYFGVDPFYLGLGEGSNLNERVVVLERKVAKLEHRVASLPAARR
jgi:transcriptional regulator with XRE-family HTH domain